MKTTNFVLVLTALVAVSAWAATAPPSAGVWNIAATGKAASSGDLEFRVTTTDGSDPVEITVPVSAGATEEAMARSIRRVLSTQLPRERFDVELGEGGNVMVSDSRGRPNFTVELLNSDIDNVRVAVQSVTPSAAPTVPRQSEPAVPPPATTAPPAIITPSQGAANEPIPVPDPIRVPAPSQSAPPPASVPSPQPSAPPSNPPTGTTAPASPPPMSPAPADSSGGAGASATAPPASPPPPR